MKQKKWQDCPVCGVEGSMHLKKNVQMNFKFKSYPNIRVKGLNEYQCRKCKEGLLTIRSRNKVEVQLAEHKARHDAATTVVAEILLVSKASQILKMTRQGVLKLMKLGKLESVYLGDKRYPKRMAVLRYGR